MLELSLLFAWVGRQLGQILQVAFWATTAPDAVGRRIDLLVIDHEHWSILYRLLLQLRLRRSEAARYPAA